MINKENEIIIKSSIEDMAEDDFISVITNPKAVVLSELKTKNNSIVYAVFDREEVLNRRQDLVSKYKLIISEDENEDYFVTY